MNPQNENNVFLNTCEAHKNELCLYVGAEPGGLSPILRLREVCSLTKTWVDSLSAGMSGFKSAVVSLKKPLNRFDTQEAYLGSLWTLLSDFLKAPPPLQVTKLAIEFDFPPELPTEESRVVWQNFLRFWHSKATFVCLRKLLLPLSNLEEEFLSNPQLELQVYTLDARRGVPMLIPNFPHSLRSITLEEVTNDVDDIPQIMVRLRENLNMQEIRFGLNSSFDADLAQQFLESRLPDTRLSVILALELLEEPDEQNNGQRLAQSIISSQSKVELVNVNPSSMKWLCYGLSNRDKQTIFGTVKTIRWWEKCRIRLEQFFNLKLLGIHSFEVERFRETLPRSLESLSLRVRLNVKLLCTVIPQNLSKLNLVMTDLLAEFHSVTALLRNLTLSCPWLTHLGLWLKFIAAPMNFRRIQPRAFQQLRSLELHMLDTAPAERRDFIIGVLRVEQLIYLERFVLSSVLPDVTKYLNFDQVESSIVETILGAACGGTLCDVEIKYNSIPVQLRELAVHIYEPLLAAAHENRARKSAVRMHNDMHFGGVCSSDTHVPSVPGIRDY